MMFILLPFRQASAAPCSRSPVSQQSWCCSDFIIPGLSGWMKADRSANASPLFYKQSA